MELKLDPPQDIVEALGDSPEEETLETVPLSPLLERVHKSGQPTWGRPLIADC